MIRFATRVATLLAFVLFLFNHSTQATHVMGSEINWEHVGKDSFQVDISVYRDCTGIALAPIDLNISCKSSGQSLSSVTKKKIGKKQVTDVTPVCKQTCTKCDKAGCNFQYGMQKHTQSFLVDLSQSSCCKVRFSYRECCRSNSITTGMDNERFYTSAWFDRCKAPNNSSPTFKYKPAAMICIDQKFIYSQGAKHQDFDSTGNPLDSFAYAQTKPLGKDSADTLSYDNPYSHKKPLRFRGFPNENIPFPYGFHFDKNTGRLAFTPNKKQVSVLANQAKEYRDVNNDGQKEQISSIRRDMQIYVVNCPYNNSPSITSMDCNNGSNVYYKEICPGQSSQFEFCSYDPDSKDTVNLSWKSGTLPNSANWQIKDTQQKHPKGVLNWTPTEQDAKKEPYGFTVQAKDGNCKINARTIESYRIRVKPEPEAKINWQPLNCGQFQFSAIPQNNSAMSFVWMHKDKTLHKGDSFQHRFTNTGKHPIKVKAVADGCKRIYMDTVTVDSTFTVDIGNDTTICAKESVQLGGNQAQGNNRPVTYTWHDNQTGYQARTFKNLSSDSLITLKASDNQCAYTDSVDITINDKPDINFSRDTIPTCTLDSVQLNAKPGYGSYLWNTNDSSNVIQVNSQGWYVLTVKDTFGCQHQDSAFVRTLDTGSIKLNTTACDNFYWPVNDTIYTQSGQYSGKQQNVNYCDSIVKYQLDLTLNRSARDSFDTTACFQYTVPSGDETHTKSGIYLDTIKTTKNCDSILQINLTVNEVDTVVRKNGNTLKARADRASYQWLNCDNGYAKVSGAINRRYTPQDNDQYAVEVTQSGCVDTSACYATGNSGIIRNEFGKGLQVYPNPTQETITIQFEAEQKGVKAEIKSVNGKTLTTEQIGDTHQFDMQLSQADGFYLIKVTNAQSQTALIKVLKK